MKRLLLLAMAVSTGSVMAQGHMPQHYGGKDKPEEAVSFTQSKYVPIRVKNTASEPSKFDIEVNGKVIGETGLIGSGVTQNIQVPVMLHEQGKVEYFEICSITKPSQDTASYRLRMCTKAKLLWAKRK